MCQASSSSATSDTVVGKDQIFAVSHSLSKKMSRSGGGRAIRVIVANLPDDTAVQRRTHEGAQHSLQCRRKGPNETDLARSALAQRLAVERDKADAVVKGDRTLRCPRRRRARAGRRRRHLPTRRHRRSAAKRCPAAAPWDRPHADEFAYVAPVVRRASGDTHVPPLENRDERRKLDDLRLPASGAPLRSLSVGRTERVRGLLQRLQPDASPPVALPGRSRSIRAIIGLIVPHASSGRINTRTGDGDAQSVQQRPGLQRPGSERKRGPGSLQRRYGRRSGTEVHRDPETSLGPRKWHLQASLNYTERAVDGDV